MDSQGQAYNFRCKRLVVERAISPEYICGIYLKKEKRKTIDMTRPE